MSCCGCFAGLSGGGGAAKKESADDSLLEMSKQQSVREIEEFHLGLDFISTVPLFKSLPLPDHPALAKAFISRKYDDKAVIIKQGDVGDRFYVIQSGKAKVIIDGNVENRLGTGDYFGEVALLHNTARNATIEAEGPVECKELAQKDFEGLGLRAKLRFKKRLGVIQKETKEEVPPPSKKTPSQATLITEALRMNKDLGPFLKPMANTELQDLVDTSYTMTANKDTVEVITQGDCRANLFYILESGTGEAIKDGAKVMTYGAKDSFGGLALLYQAPRAATVRVSDGAKLWCIPRQAMRAVLQQQVKKQVDQYAQILSNVKCLDHVSLNDKKTLADALLETTYYKDEFIIKEGDDTGTQFYILKTGECSVMVKGAKVATYKATEGAELPHFGERALITNEPRAASVRVVGDKATLLVLDRDVYLQVVKPKDDGPPPGATKYNYDALSTIGLLGCGGFGKVTLVKDGGTGQYFALKALSKGHILQEGQQASVMNEKKILRLTHSPFLVQVAATFNQKNHLLFLLEPAMGGELFTIYMKHNLSGNEKLAQFYSACVLKGLAHLHERYIIYRDMKPENLLLDKAGYCKIADFGLAKFVIGKTFTTCGTPDYFAPELLKGVGHSCSLDWWTLGILIYEFMTGNTPFQADDPGQLFAKMMRGVECADFPDTGDWPDLVKSLCRLEPSERLAVRPGGCENVCMHDWYRNSQFNWATLSDRTMPPPWDPQVKSMDCSSFDADEADAPPDLPYTDPGDAWDVEFEDVYGPATFD